jgi:nucleoprotein TPR
MNDRFKILQSNVEGYKKEIASLRDKNQKYSNVIVKHEQTINMLKDDLLETKEKMARLEVNNQSLMSQRDLLRASESRLTMEKEVTRGELQSLQMLLSNMRAINVS